MVLDKVGYISLKNPSRKSVKEISVKNLLVHHELRFFLVTEKPKKFEM